MGNCVCCSSLGLRLEIVPSKEGGNVRIKQISVTKLFGIFNHSIPLNMEEKITIIHGPNGFGKTNLLRILNAIFNSRYSILRSIPFSEFRVDFDDGSNMQVTKKPIDREGQNENKTNLMFRFVKSSSEIQTFSTNYLDESKVIDSIKMIPNLVRTSSTTWLDLPNNEELSLEDVCDRFSQLLPVNLTDLKKEPEWLLKLKSSIEVRLIGTERLLNLSEDRRIVLYSGRSQMKEAVATYSEELGKNIQAKLAEYGALSQTLDRTFPVRVVNQKAPSNLTEDTLRKKLSELEEKRSRIIEVGLLDKDETSDFQVNQEIDDRTKSILSVYIEDVENKLVVFKEIANKIELLKKIIQERFLYKKMTINKENGFTFTSADGKPLSPTDLSSGEQHELVMAYELLFKTKPNSLVLIDEPEISLHVAWQVKFVKDLQEITQLANFDILMATHSPDIISDRWDLTVELKGPTEWTE